MAVGSMEKAPAGAVYVRASTGWGQQQSSAARQECVGSQRAAKRLVTHTREDALGSKNESQDRDPLMHAGTVHRPLRMRR